MPPRAVRPSEASGYRWKANIANHLGGRLRSQAAKASNPWHQALSARTAAEGGATGQVGAMAAFPLQRGPHHPRPGLILGHPHTVGYRHPVGAGGAVRGRTATRADAALACGSSPCYGGNWYTPIPGGGQGRAMRRAGNKGPSVTMPSSMRALMMIACLCLYSGAWAFECPFCHAAAVDVPIVYGLPTPEMVAAEEKGDLFLGGCAGGDRAFGRKCPTCGARSCDPAQGWTRIISRAQYEKDIPKPLSYSKGIGKERVSVNVSPDGKETYTYYDWLDSNATHADVTIHEIADAIFGDSTSVSISRNTSEPVDPLRDALEGSGHIATERDGYLVTITVQRRPVIKCITIILVRSNP